MQQTLPYSDRPSAARAASPVVVSTTGLSKRFKGRVAVDNVDLTVYRGDVYGLLGPNGAGKTTFIALLLGLVTPNAGHRAMCGHDVATQPAEALRCAGAMIEAPAFYPYLSGRDNLRVLGGVRGPVSDERLDEVLRTVGLDGRARDRYRAYSLGMKQRLAVGLALLHDPQVLLLDEPTNGLDPRGVVEIRALIGRLAARGTTIILCTHLLHEVEQVCNRVAILRAGRVVMEGDVATLIGQGDLETRFLELTEVS